MQKMKPNVLIIADSDPRKVAIGGVSTYAFNLVKYLTKRGIKVTFLGKKQNGSIINKFKNFELVELNKKPNQSNYIFLKNLFDSTKKLNLSRDTIIHSQRPDWLVPFSKYKNKKIVTLHGSHSKNVYLKKGYIIGKLYSKLEKKGLELADTIISVSDDNAKYYINIYKNNPNITKKIITIPTGTDLGRFKHINKAKSRRKYGFDISDKIAVYVGRFEKEKNIKMMIKACKDAGIKLLLVGEGRDEHKLRKFADRTGAYTLFHPAVANEEIPNILACADVFILTSLYEGLPTVLIEALATGIPIISTDVGDVRKLVINGKTGYIVNESSIVDRLKSVMLDHLRYKNYCLEKAKDFEWDRIGKLLIELYET